MAVFNTIRPLTSGQVSAGRVTKFLFNAFGTVAEWNDTRITRKSLSQLSNRELDDIGLSRGDIETLNIKRLPY